jgi:predicted RND superfamily exporter protein
MTPMRARLERVLSHPLPILVAVGLAVGLGGAGLLRLHSDNSAEVFFERDAPRLQSLARLRALFGGGQTVRFVVPRADGSSDASRFDALRGLVDAAREIPGVAEAIGPADVPSVASEPAFPSAVERLAGDPFARGLGLWSDHAASALVTLAQPLPAGVVRDEVLARLEFLSAGRSGLDGGSWVGAPWLIRAFDRSALEIVRLWFPLLVAIAIALLVVLFRQVTWVVAPLAYVGACEVITLGAAGALGFTLNLVVSILPPLLFVIALATALHLATRVRALLDQGLDPRGAVLTAFDDKGAAILWTTLSAAVGFGSLALSTVPPVRDLGRLAVLGLASIALLAFTLLPWVLWWAARRGAGARREESLGLVGVGLAEGAVHRFRGVLVIVGLAVILGGLGMPRLRVESDGSRYLPEAHPVRVAADRAEELGVGFSAIEWLLEAPAGVRFDDGPGVNRLSWVSLRLRDELAEQGVLSTVSAGELVESALLATPEGRSASGGSAPRAAALQTLRSIDSGDDGDAGARALAVFLSEDGRTARLTMFVRSGGYPELDRILEPARAIFAEEMPEVSAEPTGQYALLLDTQRSLLRTLGVSFLATVAGVLAILYLLLRRVRLTLLALVPNVLPVWLVLGIMGWAGIPLDLATVMVASTTLGLALDDTLHTLVPFRKHVGEHGTFDSLLQAVEKNAAAYSVSGLVLGLGFLVCALSSFAPIRRFGGLSALAIALAVAADFLLVPALLGGLPAHWVVKRKKP